jgi:hypothetical protein
MPKTSEMYPSRFLKASDFEDGDRALTIADIRSERVGQGAQADDKWVLFFKEEEKGLVLNKTNTTIIAKLYGDDTDDWFGKPVTLYATEVQFKDDMVDAIRVRSKAPRPARKEKVNVPSPPEADDDDEPFSF